ncbi:MAG: hypothetical protein AAFX39_06825 [Pseudomonadota bacterium]
MSSLRFALPACALLLSACGSGDGALSGIGDALTLGPREEFVELQQQQQTETQTQVFCPPVEIRQGTETLRVYAADRQDDPMGVRYQATMTRTARECSVLPDGQFTMKFGLTGRVVVGPAGQPETVTVPIRAALVGNGEAVWTKLIPLPVSVVAGSPSVEFVHVDSDLVYAFPPGTDLTRYILYVGFDAQEAAQR